MLTELHCLGCHGSVALFDIFRNNKLTTAQLHKSNKKVSTNCINIKSLPSITVELLIISFPNGC